MTSPTQWTPADLQAFIERRGIAAEIVYPGRDTPSVPAAVEALGCAPEQIVKSVLFLIHTGVDDRLPVLVIASGLARVDYRALAARFGVNRKRIKLAAPSEVLEILGYPAGGVPPFGHRTPPRVLMDDAVTRQTVVYGGGGDDRSLVRITVEGLRALLDPEIGPFTERSSGPTEGAP